MTVGRILQKYISLYLYLGLFFQKPEKFGTHTGSKWWPGDPVTRTWKMTQMTRWPNDPVPCLWGSAVSSPGVVRGRAPAAGMFSCILEAPDGLSWNSLGFPSPKIRLWLCETVSTQIDPAGDECLVLRYLLPRKRDSFYWQTAISKDVSATRHADCQAPLKHTVVIMTGFWDSSGISWTIRKQSAPRCRQITTPTSQHSIFTDRMLFLTPNQQYQSTVHIHTCT